MAADTRSRKWQITQNNPADHGVTHDSIKVALSDMPLVYWCMCDEIGEGGTYHICLYVHSKNAIYFSRIKKAFPAAHIEAARGLAQENRAYIRKEGKWENTKKKDTNLPETFEEWPIDGCPHEEQGRRNDMIWLRDQIMSGKSDTEILDENPRYLFQIDKIERVRQRYMETRFKKERRLGLRVEYVFGPTGSGKTCHVMDTYGDENVYRVTDYDHPFDQYRCEDVLVFEEFRSSLPIESMLVYLDVYSVQLPCRYANKQACYTKVFILTNIPFERQYPNIQLSSPETFAAFRRRVHNIEYLPYGVVTPGFVKSTARALH